jgi:hypothetical protein
VDPNSFLVYGIYEKNLGGDKWLGPFQQPFYFNYRFAGAEFNRTGDQINFVTSPMLTVPMRLSGKLQSQLPQGVSTFPSVNLVMGTEFVDVEKSVLAPTGHWHTRGLLGATFAAGVAPKKPWLYSVQFTSSYQIRLPSAPEIYFDPKFATVNPATGKVGATPPRLGTQPRHSIDSKVTYNIFEWFGFTFEHTYGSLPPSFVKTDQTFALGLTFTLKETSNARYAILRP